MNRGVGFIVPLVSVALFLFFIIPTQTSFNSLGVIVPVDMTALFAAGVSTNTFWIMLTAVGMAGATFSILEDRREDDKTESHLS